MTRSGVLLATLVCLVTAAQPGRGQGMMDRLKQKVEDRTNAKADSAMNASLDKIEGAIHCVASDKSCIKKGTDAGTPVIVTNDQGAALATQPYIPAPAVQAAPAAQSAVSDGGTPGTGLWVNYDFVPGDSVIFAEDFARDPVGEFPRRLELKSGNFEVATLNGAAFLRSTSGGAITISLGGVLPQRFTIEADMMVLDGGYARFTFVDPEQADAHGALSFNPTESGVTGPGTTSTSAPSEELHGKMFHARAMVDGKHVKVYVNDKRVANAPNIDLGRSSRIWMSFPGDEGMPLMLTNIRIAAGGKTLYDAISTTGRATTHGLLFDTGSDQLRGESTPTLKLIGDMLTQHPDLKLTIEGHTDDVGAAASNQALSEKRSAAVKAFLVTTYHIDATRLATKGFGSSKPTSLNSTPEGRQTNRRVELVKV
jgi:OmpA-OmpF porin, OOP family